MVEVHDLHVWEVTSGFPALSAHITVAPDADCHAIRRSSRDLLESEYGIQHTTLQVEHVGAPELLSIEDRRARLRAMAVATQPKPLGHPLPGGPRGATVRLRPLLAAELHAPPGWFDSPGGRFAMPRVLLSREERVWVPVPAFLVEHPGAGRVLIDTGLHASVGMEPAESLGSLGARFVVARGVEGGVPARLRELRIHTRDVSTVIITHLHFDHASGISEFPEATFVIDGVSGRRRARAA